MWEAFNWITTHAGLVASCIGSVTAIIVAVTKTKNAIISSLEQILDDKLKRLIS